ncbi:hypothetical protein CAPTEDRAFT_122230 [Capitella teleta]|uniref:Histone deacetylase complex subunit SAP30 Sin3 binding domain-containing protein n=1 Tax=Capitella teleta TaxID=283909 RepID=R7VBF5_CAPTE|nr:hypothetical protein CAPTEDRAFT_122230 [Capitella teleta]|eukprot:ELU13636.1 hypothetical protein CAPTEDRAFT_122230 [Capitella teleta]
MAAAEDVRSSSSSNHGQTCCLIDDGDQCRRSAGNASYSKRIQKNVQQRRLKLNINHGVRHIYICEYHKAMIQNSRNGKRKRKDSEMDADSPDLDFDHPELDFVQMPVNTLRRYKRHYKLQTRPGLSKTQLAEMVSRHFKTIHVVEKEVLTFFIYMAKSHKSRFDSKHDASS